MAMTRAEKEQEITELKQRFERNETIVIVRNMGLNAEETADLRKKMHKEGVEFKVAKNTLAKRAIEGTKFAQLANSFSGPTGFAASKDMLAAARAVYSFAKDHEKFVIVTGASGSEIMDQEKIKFLALLPSLDALRGKIIGILQAPGAQLARLANAYAEKGGAGGASASAAAPAEQPQA